MTRIQPLSCFEVQGRIGQLWVHPIKSCAGTRVSRSRLFPTGLEWDRRWMVVDAEGVFVSQRELPYMARIHPRVDASHLHVTAPGVPPLVLPLTSLDGCERVRVKVWGDEVSAIDMGQASADWFTQYLAQPGASAVLRSLRLVAFDTVVASTQPRLSSDKWTGGLAVPNLFGDGFPLLATSQASLDDLNARLVSRGALAVDMRRFRPNLVLEGLEAHDEDRLEGLALDVSQPNAALPVRVFLALTKPCARCPIPDVDPDTAERGTAVGDTLATYRRDARLKGAVTFGVNGFAQTALPEGGLWLHEGQRFGASWRFD